MDKGGRGRSAAHVEAVLHGQRMEAARGERGDEATRALG
jgi:hypothetical protein